MRDETDFARWGLIGLVIMVIALAAMKEWYKDRPGPRPAASTNVRRTSRPSAPPPLPTTSVMPATPMAASTAPREPETRYLDMPVVELPDGRTLGFSKLVERNRGDHWTETDRVFPWVWSDATQERSDLPPIPSLRDQFTALLLKDGRLVLVGGRTPRDVVALERRCDTCPDEYVPFGDALPSFTTDVFDFKTSSWSAGPVATAAGNTDNSTIRLNDGRLFKVSVDLDTQDGVTTTIVVEISDSKFTRWKRAGEFRARNAPSTVRKMVEHLGGVDVEMDAAQALRWNPPDKLALLTAETEDPAP